MKTRLAFRVSDLVTLVVCLLVLALLNAATRDGFPDTRWYIGKAGQQITSPMLDVTAATAQLAHTVTDRTTSMTSTTGVLVVVEWSAAVKRTDAYLGSVDLVTVDGIRYRHRGQFATSGLANSGIGFTSHGSSVFEMHPEQLPGAWLEIIDDVSSRTHFTGSIRVTDIIDPRAPVLPTVALPEPYAEVTP